MFSDILYAVLNFMELNEEGARSRGLHHIDIGQFYLKYNDGQALPLFACKETHICVRRRHLSGMGELNANRDFLVLIHRKRLHSFIFLFM